jgi:RNA polymerase sigma-70 factor (ECF subfamily)
MATPLPSELIQRARSADPQALSAIYEHFAQGIFRYIYYRVGDVETARDVQSEVFLRMLEGIEHYEDRGWSISAWLYRIAHDRTIDVLRRRERQQTRPLDTWFESGDEYNDEGIDQADRVTLYTSMNQLAPDHRQVLLLRFVYDLSLQETARQMGRSVGSIKSLQHRAVHALRNIVQPTRVDAA